MGRALEDLKRGELKFMLNKKEVTFNVRRTMKHPTNIRVVLVINSVDESGGQPMDRLMKSN